MFRLEAPALVAQALEAHADRLRAKSRTRRYAGAHCADIRHDLRAKATKLEAEATSIRAQLRAAGVSDNAGIDWSRDA